MAEEVAAPASGLLVVVWRGARIPYSWASAAVHTVTGLGGIGSVLHRCAARCCSGCSVLGTLAHS